MVKRRHILALLLSVSLFPVGSKSAQSKYPENAMTKSDELNLEMTANGEVILLAGRRGVFRTFRAPDGTSASFIAGRFRSVGDAKHQTEQWLKIAMTVTSREQKKDERGHAAGLRVVGAAEDKKSSKKEFVIVVRSGLDCYLVQAESLPVALQVEKENKAEDE